MIPEGTIEKWPFGEALLAQLLILKQEEERTKQEQIRLQNTETTLQVLKIAMDAKIPPHMIPEMFTKQASTKSSNPNVSNVSESTISNNSINASEVTASGMMSPNTSVLKAPSGPVNTTNILGSFSTSGSIAAASLKSPPYTGSPYNQSLSNLNNLNSPQKKPASPTSLPPLPPYLHHQRSSTISSSKDLYTNKPSTPSSPLASQYITHQSPFKFPAKAPSPVKQQPKKNEQPASIGAFQHVIQFHHWHSEDPGAMYKKEHQRRRLNPEIKPARVSKPPNSPGLIQKTKKRIFNHTRTRLEGVGAEDRGHLRFNSLVDAAIKEDRKEE